MFVRRTALLVDGGFYRRRAGRFFRDNDSSDTQADNLFQYCVAHLTDKRGLEEWDLYRIFYYDCAPANKKIFHPLLKKTVHLGNSEMYRAMNSFLNHLKRKRKFALRLGDLDVDYAEYVF